MTQESGRRAGDNPHEAVVRIALGVVFAFAGVVLGFLELTVPMSACFVMCGAMMKIPIGKVLPK